MIEDKLKICNNQWLEKYGTLKCSYEQLECDYLQIQNQFDLINQDREILKTTINSQNSKLLNLSENCNKLNEDNSHLIHENCLKEAELERICCEKTEIENCNMEMTRKLESMNNQLRTAHREICELTIQLHENQEKVNEFSVKLKENPSTIKHYGSHPLLNKIDRCSADVTDFDQKDYCDLKTRYSALCNQIDNLINQLKKKDKRIMEIQKEKEILCHNLSNYDQIQCDYQELDYKYQQLKDDFNNLSHYYQNINYSHNQKSLEMQNHEASVIQGCAEELQETIDCHNREIEEMKLAQQALENDYRICCNRVKELEDQIRIDNLELEKWNQSYYNSENNCKQLEEKFDQLKYVYDDAICQLDQLNELKQDLIDKTNRINEITHINDNIEQQILKAHQQINNQNQIIENYKAKLNEMELYYEKEIEQYRHELTKSAEKSTASINYEEIINCLKEKNHSLECELLDLQNQCHELILNLNELKSQQECLLVKTEQLKQEYDQQCANIDKLSGQLFDKNDLIEQMSAENHQINSDLEMNHLKITQLTEQNDCLNQFLLEKNNELHSAVDNSIAKERESIKLSNHANYLTGQLEQRNSIIEDFKKELAINYDNIEEMKQENSKLCDEIEKLSRLNVEKDQCINSKNELLNQYCKELEMNYELIHKLQSEKKPKSSISAQEFFEMKQINEKLNEELEYLHRKLDINIQSTETQTLKDKQQNELHPRDYLIDSPSPISDFRVYNEQDSFTKLPSENKETDLTYSTTKSVAWKSTHTDKPENVGSGVLELQKAIDEYNTLVTSIEMSDGLLNINDEKESVKKYQKISSGNLGASISPDLSSLNPKIDIDMPNQDKVEEIDIIVVDVDSMLAPIGTLNSNIPIHVQTVSNEETIEHFHQPHFKEVINLLKNCNVQIDFDETKETFDSYFQRMMQKYNELEQFYLASMKINLETLEDPSNIQNIEIFSELYEKSQQKLIQNCQLLKSSVSFNILELNDNIQSINDQKLTPGDLLKLADLITTQQLQLGAINLTYMNLQKLIPIDNEKQHNVIPTYLTEEYQKIWLTKDLCHPNIVTSSLNVSQLSLDKKVVPNNEKKEMISPVNFKNQSMESLSIYQDSHNEISKGTFLKEEPKLNLAISHNSLEEYDTLQNKFEKSNENLTHIIIEKDSQDLLPENSTNVIENMLKKDSKSINFPNINELNNLSENVENQNSPETGIKLDSTPVILKNDHMNTGQEFQQQIYQSSTIPESKTQAIATLEDAISYASIGQFEKTLHQLNSIDFENFDGSIDMKDRVRIYAAEIDYLNEKNLFHSYAINTITNPTRYPLNTNFIHQITKSLTTKAKFIDTLQKEFKFEPHISKKEKQLIDKILDSKNSFTFEKLFENWINEMGTIENQKTSEELTEKIKELTKKLELCQSQMNVTNVPDDNSKLIETLISEKKILSNQLNDCMLSIGKMNQESSPLVLKSPGSEVDSVHQQLQTCKSTMELLTKENERLKDLLKSSSEKVQSVHQEYTHDKSKQSKIPLLRGSTIEGFVTSVDRKSMKWEDVNKRLLTDMTNISKNIHQVTENVGPFKNTDNNADELVRASKEIIRASTKMEQEISVIKSSHKIKKQSEKDDKSLLQSTGKLVSPEEVKLAIEGETSMESLKKFAILLAEDNFDLAAEIEKLLVTIEELRRQLKENCEILSETVDMLQNSENFVNQLEKKLNIETKKTQVITTRIDKLNELNGRVIFELERILKQPPSTATADMSSQERYDYLFECLKKIESENLSLLKKKDELEKELTFIKSNNTYNFLGPILTGPIDFEFETSLMPNGAIEGTINMRNNDDISKKLDLTFDVCLSKDEKLFAQKTRDSTTLSHFLIEREAAYSEQKTTFTSKNKTNLGDYSSNNNSNNHNNNCCYRDITTPLSKSLIDTRKIYSSFDDNYRTCVGCLNNNTANNRRENSNILLKNTFSSKIMSQSNSISKLKNYEFHNKKLSDSKSSSFIYLSQSSVNLYSCQQWLSTSSISSSENPKKSPQFINYRKPIYFRSICERL